MKSYPENRHLCKIPGAVPEAAFRRQFGSESSLMNNASPDQSTSSKSVKTAMNPFAVTDVAPLETGIFGRSKRVRSNFLHRVIDVGEPHSFRLKYDGWWFSQKIEIDGTLVSRRISWLTVQRKVEFPVPPKVDSSEPKGRIEIDFTRGLMIRRFRVWIADELVYDEIN